MTTISITRALATIKSLGSKIERDIGRLQLYAITQGTGSMQRVLGYSEAVKAEQVSEAIRKDWQSVNDMITQRSALKAAVVASNAVTKVTIAGKEMTVAEAIEQKTSMQFKIQLLARMRKSYVQMTNELSQAQDRFDRQVQETEENLFGKDKKVTDAERKTVIDPVYMRSQPGTVDGIDLEKRTKDLEDEIQDFMSEVDFVLSESNASTTIEV